MTVDPFYLGLAIGYVLGVVAVHIIGRVNER